MFKRAYVEITNICNLQCAFCPGTKRPGRFMPPEEFRILARRLRPHTGFLYLHVMGEPLLHPQLGELLEIGAAEGFRICLTTNGTLLEQIHQLLLSAPVLHKLSVSLHSMEGNNAGALDGYLTGVWESVQALSRAHLRPSAVEHRGAGVPQRRDSGISRGQAGDAPPGPAPTPPRQLAAGAGAVPGAGGEVRLA